MHYLSTVPVYSTTGKHLIEKPPGRRVFNKVVCALNAWRGERKFNLQ